MKIKKLLALLMAAAMVASFGTTALAAVGSATGTTTVDVDGQTIYIDTEIYSVVLPTVLTMTFTLDPQGLLDIEESAKLDELKGGKVIGPAPIAFVNNSAVPVVMSVDLTGASAAGSGEGAGEKTATFVTAADAVENSNGTNNILLVATPAADNMATAAATYSPTEKGLAITSTKSTIQFALPAADYTIEYTGTSDEHRLDASKYVPTIVDGTGKGSALKLGGAINSQADWTDFTKAGELASKITLEAVFSYAKDTDTHVAADYDDTGAAYLLTTTMAKVDSPETPPVPEETPLGFMGFDSGEPTNATYDVAANGSGSITVGFNFGESKSAVVKFPSGTAIAMSGNYSIDYGADNEGEGSITFTVTRANSIRSGAANNDKYTVTVNGVDYTLNWNVTT